MTMRVVTLPCSFGEAADKVTILQIKSAQMRDAVQLQTVRAELALVSAALFAAIEPSSDFDTLMARLKAINEALWRIEEDIRICDSQGDFGPQFVALARAVYRMNDERAATKREINLLLGSDLREEKSYPRAG